MVRSFTRLEYQKCSQQEMQVAAGSLGPDLQTNAQVYRRDVWKTATMSTTCRSRRSSPSVTGVEQDLLKQQVDGKCQQSRKSIHHGAVESLSPAGWNHRKCKEPSCCKVNFFVQKKRFFDMKMFPKLKMVPKRSLMENVLEWARWVGRGWATLFDDARILKTHGIAFHPKSPFHTDTDQLYSQIIWVTHRDND